MRRILIGALLVASACRPLDDAAKTDAGPAVLASADKSPPKTPPPLRLPKPPVPPLPELPPIASQEPASKLPFGMSRSVLESPCLGVWNGFEVSGTGCARGSILFGHGIDDGADPLVSTKKLAPLTAGLPSVVDHRLERTEGPIRNQGRSPACTAFAMAAAIDHAIARWKGDAPKVSAMEIWARYHSPYAAKSIQANIGLGISSEDGWPFDVGEAMSMLACDDGGPKGRCGKVPDPLKVTRTTQKPIATFTHVEFLHAPDIGTLEQKLAAGQDIVVSIELPEAFVPKGKAGAMYIPDYDKPGKDAGHALVIAGYASLAHGHYFLLHNSWGPAWGDGGYAWMHEKTLFAHIKEALVFDAEPADAPTPGRPKRQRGETTCAPGLVPDSIRGTCSAACADGSPRHDNVCAVAGQCPAGYVNLTGQCVRAAPSVRGNDGALSWTCGPGGCAYVVPKKLSTQCTGGTCMTSCPAPSYRLAEDDGKLTCVE